MYEAIPIISIIGAIGFYCGWCARQAQINNANNIISGFKTMLTFSHLSENNGTACNYCRKLIDEYERRYK